MDYKIKETREGELSLALGSYSVVKVYFNGERTQSPLNREEADELANIVKCWVENKHPSSELDEEDYKSHTPSFGDFMKFLASECADDDD